MVRAVIQGDLDVDDRIAGQNAGLHRALDTVRQQAGIYSFGIAPPTIALTNS